MENVIEQLKNCFVCDPHAFVEGEVSVFQQQITLDKDTDVAVWISALGVFEAEIDGKKIGDQLLSPGFTYYPKHLQYQKETLSLKQGKHIFRVFLGQGWYCGRFTFDNKTQLYGQKPAISWIMKIDQKIISSKDESVVLMSSPYTYAGLYDGEIYQAGVLTNRNEKPVCFEGNIPELFTERKNAIRFREEIRIRDIKQNGDATIIDFGQNFAGVVCIDPQYMDGTTLKIRHGELLNRDGSLYTNNLRQAKQQIIYTKDEKDTSVYIPRFTYMGFRYIELSGCTYQEGLIKAYALYSDMKRTGAFTCENENVQKLYDNLVWGQKSNYVEVPTDCPQRDERMGYTGDAHVFARCGAYNFDTRDFLQKFLTDMQDSQTDSKDGYIPSTSPSMPNAKMGMLNMLGWGNAITLIPEMLYEQFGDEKYLIDQYETIKRWVDLECRKCRLKGLWTGMNLGDWLMVGKDLKYMAMHNGPVSNSFVIHDFLTASNLAEKLGKQEDAERWKKALVRANKAYRKKYILQNGEMKDDYQGAYVMALKWVLEKDEPLYEKVYQKLKAHLMNEGLQTGFFATEHVLNILSENGDAKVAYDLLLNNRCPGWMYEVEHGATTIWERWDALDEEGNVNESKMSDDNMVSFNHYAFGSVGEFYYRYILGIEPLKPGFEELLFQPKTDERLKEVSGSYDSVSGKIISKWKYKGDQVEVYLCTPVKTKAVLEDGSERIIEKGEYTFTYTKEGKSDDKI